jgi:PIN domain nuclease of toxin-antitoxin system
MSSLVADTHTVVWYLLNDSRLSPAAREALDAASAAGDPVFVSAISVSELVYLVEKGRVPPGR